MTLTLEQVRQTRFHLARRNGYEPVDVDNFVDKVEATLSQMTEENETLKQQIETLSATEPASIFVPGDNDEFNRLRGELDGVRNELQQRQSEIDQLRGELAARDEEISSLRGQVDHLRGELGSRDAELGGLRGEVEGLRQAAAAPVEQAEGAPTGKVENIVVTAATDAAPAVTRLLQMATEQAERLVGESQVEAQRLVNAARDEAQVVIDTANRKAHETLTDARTRADRIESEARVNAERMTGDAQANADSVNAAADQRRAELFTALEQERDWLRGRVDHLRSFEQKYRTAFTAHLQNQIEQINSADFQPSDVPDILSEPAQQSATPRLDALLNEQG